MDITSHTLITARWPHLKRKDKITNNDLKFIKQDSLKQISSATEANKQERSTEEYLTKIADNIKCIKNQLSLNNISEHQKDKLFDIMLENAIGNKQPDIVRLLINEGKVDVNFHRETSLHTNHFNAAVIMDNIKIVQLLLNAGADVNLTSGNEHPISLVARFGSADMLMFLIEQGIDVNCNIKSDCENHNNAIYQAVLAEVDTHKKIRYLLLNDANINIKFHKHDSKEDIETKTQAYKSMIITTSKIINEELNQGKDIETISNLIIFILSKLPESHKQNELLQQINLAEGIKNKLLESIRNKLDTICKKHEELIKSKDNDLNLYYYRMHAAPRGIVKNTEDLSIEHININIIRNIRDLFKQPDSL